MSDKRERQEGYLMTWPTKRYFCASVVTTFYSSQTAARGPMSDEDELKYVSPVDSIASDFTFEDRERISGVFFGALRLYSSYVTRDGRPVHRNFGSSLKRNLNVRTATLRVGHLARGLYATVTTRIHSTGPPPSSVMTSS